MRVDAIIFVFDGVLLESEYEINALVAKLLTDFGHPTPPEEATRRYTGLSGQQFIDAIESRIGRPLPQQFHEEIREASIRALREGISAVAGAIEFVRALPPALPKAVASSSSTKCARTHLADTDLAETFQPDLFKRMVQRARSQPS